MNFLTVDFDKKREWWKYITVLVLSLLVGQLVGAIPLIIVVVSFIVKYPELAHTIKDVSDIYSVGIDSNLLLALMLLPFVVSMLVLFVLIKPFHKRGVRTLFTGSSKIRWKRFFVGALVWLMLLLADFALSYSLNPQDFVLNFNANSFLVLFLVAIVLIPIQASTEEILFRGYLAQGVAAVTKNKIWVIIIPSIIFGLLHAANPEISEYGFWLTMPQYIIFGLLFGLISVLDNGIEIAMGAHSINNLFLSLIITSKSSALQTDAIFYVEQVNPVWSLISIIISSLIFIFVIFKIYNLNFNTKIKITNE